MVLLNVRDFARRRRSVLSDRCFRKPQRLNFRLEGARGLRSPRGGADRAAEIDASEVRVLIREHVGVDVAEGRLRLVLVAVVEGLDDVLLETRSTRMRMHHRLALRVAVFGMSQA